MGWGSLGLPHGDKISWNGGVCPAHVSSVRTYKEIWRNIAEKLPKVWLVGAGGMVGAFTCGHFDPWTGSLRLCPMTRSEKRDQDSERQKQCERPSKGK